MRLNDDLYFILAQSVRISIDEKPKESIIEWYEREKQANQPIVTSSKGDRLMNRIFYFCVGVVICFVAWKLKN